MKIKLVQALTLAFQYTNQTILDIAIEEMANDLSGYPEKDVMDALRRCRNELKTIRFSDILDRLPGGYQGPNEAWASVSRIMNNENESIVWTDPMRKAWGVAVSLGDDLIAARMAFIESYTKLVSEARMRGEQPKWIVSLGWSESLRERAILEAVEKKQISQSHAEQLAPSLRQISKQVGAVASEVAIKMGAK